MTYVQQAHSRLAHRRLAARDQLQHRRLRDEPPAVYQRACHGSAGRRSRLAWQLHREPRWLCSHMWSRLSLRAAAGGGRPGAGDGGDAGRPGPGGGPQGAHGARGPAAPGRHRARAGGARAGGHRNTKDTFSETTVSTGSFCALLLSCSFERLHPSAKNCAACCLPLSSCQATEWLLSWAVSDIEWWHAAGLLETIRLVCWSTECSSGLGDMPRCHRNNSTSCCPWATHC